MTICFPIDPYELTGMFDEYLLKQDEPGLSVDTNANLTISSCVKAAVDSIGKKQSACSITVSCSTEQRHIIFEKNQIVKLENQGSNEK